METAMTIILSAMFGVVGLSGLSALVIMALFDLGNGSDDSDLNEK